MTVQEYTVEVKPDFLERQTKAPPVQALAELIWNGLDADATHVGVDFEHDGLGGMSKIVVSDNGHGMPHADAPELFKNLGGSWKRQRSRTLSLNRTLHGQEGRGRFKAFALGDVVDWKVAYEKDGTPFRYDITILEHEIGRVRVSDEEPLPGAPTGVIVAVSELKKQFSSLKPENSLQELSEIFAIYLKDYRDVQITLGSERIDPSLAVAGVWEFSLSSIRDEQGLEHAVTLEVIEWRRQTRRTLYLCNEHGFPLSQVESRFHVGDFHFSGYLKSSFVRELHQEGRLDLAEMVPDLVAAIEDARVKFKELFRRRATERARIVVEEWKEKKSIRMKVRRPLIWNRPSGKSSTSLRSPYRVDGLKWHFWIISGEYNNQVAARIRNGPDPQRRLIQKGDRVTVGVKTWGEILEENNARLQFVKEKLEHHVDEGQALAFLQERHREFLEGVLIERGDDTSVESSDDAKAAE